MPTLESVNPAREITLWVAVAGCVLKAPALTPCEASPSKVRRRKLAVPLLLMRAPLPPTPVPAMRRSSVMAKPLRSRVAPLTT